MYFVDRKCREKEFEIEWPGFWELVWLQESKGSVTERKSTGANKNQLALFLQSAGLVKVRKLWFAGGCKRLILVYQDVQRDGVIGVREVLFGQFFSFVQCFDPVKQLRSIFWGSEIRGLVSFESFVLSFFSYRAAFGSSPER